LAAAAELPRERVGGEWKSAEDQITQSSKEQAVLLAADPGLAGYTVRVKVRLSHPQLHAEGGLAIHYRDADDFIVYSIQEKKGGAFVVLRICAKPRAAITADQMLLPGPADQWHELKADVHGKDVYCYLDGKPSLAFTFAGTEPHLGRKVWDVDPTQGKVGLFSMQTQADFSDYQLSELKDFDHIITPQTGRRDGEGKLLPRQSYANTMQLSSDWMLDSGKYVETEMLHPSLRHQPPYLLGNWVGGNNVLWPGGEFAFNHGMHIDGAVEEYIFTGDPKYLEIARKTADWQLVNGTPQTYAAPHLAPSFLFYQPDGSWINKDWGYDLDKSAYLGTYLIKLYAITGEKKYLEHAVAIADTLTKFQEPAGNWPFRVNAQTGKIAVGYTCSQFFYFEFYNRLAEATGDQKYSAIGQRAFDWLMDHPVKTNQWTGFFGDFDNAGSATSYNQWVPLALAIYLVDHRNENSTYLGTAKGLVDWVNHTLVMPDGYHPGIPGVSEQTGDKTLYMHHQLRLAEAHAKLFEATGDQHEHDLAEQIANSTTWLLMSDGKMRIGFWITYSSIPMVLVWNSQYTRLMSCLPETAPAHENHLLQYTSFVRKIDYQPKQIAYQCMGKSYDVLKLASAPAAVYSGGTELSRLEEPRKHEAAGYQYAPDSGLLKIYHDKPDVRVVLE